MDALITKAGLQALLTAQRDGTPLVLNQIKISSTSITPTGDETNLDSIVYTVPSSKVLKTIEDTSMIIRVHLDKSVGPFSIGTFGIFTATNVLFAVASFPGAGAKVADALPATLGNDKTFYLIVKYDDLAANITLTLGDPLSGLLTPVGFPVGGTTVTARQLRIALASNLSTVIDAVDELAVTDAARIGWDTSSPVTRGDAVSDMIQDALSLSTGQLNNLFATAALQTP